MGEGNQKKRWEKMNSESKEAGATLMGERLLLLREDVG